MLNKFILVTLFIIIIFIILKFTTVRYNLMVCFMDFKLFLRKNEKKFVLYLTTTSLNINNLLNLLNKNELIRELEYFNKLPTRFIYSLNFILKISDKLIHYLLIFIKNKK